jgi:hypothetical protein
MTESPEGTERISRTETNSVALLDFIYTTGGRLSKIAKLRGRVRDFITESRNHSRREALFAA